MTDIWNALRDQRIAKERELKAREAQVRNAHKWFTRENVAKAADILDTEFNLAHYFGREWEDLEVGLRALVVLDTLDLQEEMDIGPREAAGHRHYCWKKILHRLASSLHSKANQLP
jgi:hypothetical protein